MIAKLNSMGNKLLTVYNNSLPASYLQSILLEGKPCI